jgi:hypothetical protein
MDPTGSMRPKSLMTARNQKQKNEKDAFHLNPQTMFDMSLIRSPQNGIQKYRNWSLFLWIFFIHRRGDKLVNGND